MTDRLRITIDSRLRVRAADLRPAALEALRDAFTHPNPDRAREKRRRAAGGMARGPLPEEFIRTWREEGGELSMPRGGTQRVRDVLAAHGIEWEFVDERAPGTGPTTAALVPAPHIENLPFQAEMVRAAGRTQNCLLLGPTGCGKTVIAELLATGIGLCTLILVPTANIFRQWQKRLRVDFNIRARDVGVIRGATERVQPFTVAMVQTFALRARKFKGVFGVLLFDEVHRAAAKTFYPAVDECDARYRIGFTADEKRKDGKHFLVRDLFGPIAAKASRKELIEAGVIVDTEIRMIPTEFEAQWYVDLDDAQKLDPTHFGRLLDEMIEDDARTRLAVDAALQEMEEGHVVLMFSHRVAHCARVRADIAAEDPRVGIVAGEGYEAESKETLERMSRGEIAAAVGTYGQISTGVDLPAADRGVAMTPIHNNRGTVGQTRGRVCRKDRREGARKVDSALYYLWDARVYGAAPLRNMLRWNAGRVRVLEAGQWVDGRAYLKRMEARS